MTLSQPSRTLPSDPVGALTLERMAQAPAYNRWMYDRIARWIASPVLEIGSGIGNISQFLIGLDRVVLTDTDSRYQEELLRRFVERRVTDRRAAEAPVAVNRRSGIDRRAMNVEVVEMTLPSVPAALAGEQFESIVCLNVLEHVKEDLPSLQTMHSLLRPGGRLILLVPALPFLYGSLDRALGHYRRYTPKALRGLYERAGLTMRHLEYFNLPGIVGWWVTGRLLRREKIPLGPLHMYDKLVPAFRLERFLPIRVGMSLVAVGERAQ